VISATSNPDEAALIFSTLTGKKNKKTGETIVPNKPVDLSLHNL